MILWQLFWSFCKIGFTSFGGLSMVPLINAEMISHGWMTSAEVSDILAIAEMTPGPNGLNCAIFAGLRVSGFPGCFSATLGMLSPSLTLCAAAALAFERFRTSTVVKRFMTGVRPATLALIIAVMVSMFQSNYYIGGNLSLRALLIGVFDFWLLCIRKTGIIKAILISAVLGLLLF